MVKKIKWSNTSKQQLKIALDYLIANFGVSTAEKFQIILEEKTYTLARFPNIGRKSSKESNIHQLVITKHNTLLYEIHDDTIFVVEIFDNRQRPK